HSTKGEKLYWRCVERKVCNARCHTNADLDNLRMLKDGTDVHINHEADHRAIKARKVMRGVKRAAEEHPNDPPQRTKSHHHKLLRTAAGAVTDPEVRARLPERNTMRRVINLPAYATQLPFMSLLGHPVHQNRGRPRNPRELQDIVLDAPCTTTRRGSRFLLFDSGIDDPDRIIVLCSEESLRVLTWSETIYADGTFKTVPNQFGQLYTIHGVMKDVASRSYVFPLVFALCVRKDIQTYRKIWDAIKQEAERLNLRFKVRMFMTDFEIAAMNMQQAIFPGVEHKGCLFHFNQALWRQTVDSGLKVLYHYAENEDHTVRRDVQRLMALPFVPIPDLEETFDAVVDDMDDRVMPLATTMDSTYLRGANLRRRCVVPPRFLPALWNVHQQAVDDSARTNNVVEGWHSKFQKLLVVHHANVWKFLDEVIDEEHDFHQLLAQVRAGQINIKQPTNKKDEMCQRRLHNLANNYEEYKERNEIMLYLQAVAYNIKIQD
ncbi:ATP-dependent DNA helicase CHL1, partial [Frankliniella fusca]